MNILFSLLIIIAIVILWSVFRAMRINKFLKSLTEEEFIKGYRKAQLIDVREPKEYENGHILGARNIPLTQLKQTIPTLRKDKPVYLYCQGTARSQRAAQTLHKEGFEKIFQLEGGFRHWTGNIKAKN